MTRGSGTIPAIVDSPRGARLLIIAVIRAGLGSGSVAAEVLTHLGPLGSPEMKLLLGFSHGFLFPLSGGDVT